MKLREIESLGGLRTVSHDYGYDSVPDDFNSIKSGTASMVNFCIARLQIAVAA